MRLIVFTSPSDHPASTRLRRRLDRIENLAPEWSSNPVDFKKSIASGISADMVILFMATEADQLAILEALHPYLFGAPIILILPDNTAPTIARGLRLHPRLKLNLSDDFDLLAAVISNYLIHVSPARHNFQEERGA
jgi:hypothetical protein